MGDPVTKSGVAITCIVKTALDKTLAADMKTFIIDRIEACVGKSKKLEVDVNTKSGFSFDAILELTKEHELRQILIQSSQAVVDPRAYDRLTLVELVAFDVRLDRNHLRLRRHTAELSPY
jgi:hypothetical protein